MLSRLQLPVRLDFDGDVEGQRVGADGGARLRATVTEHRRHGVAEAVDDLRLLAVAVHAVHEAVHLRVRRKEKEEKKTKNK